MKRIFLYAAISLLPAIAYAQYTTGNKPQGAGDRGRGVRRRDRPQCRERGSRGAEGGERPCGLRRGHAAQSGRGRQGRPERSDAAAQVRRPEFPVALLRDDQRDGGDAGFENIWGLQDCAETLNEFASEELKQKYLPWVSAGATCAMDLTEPDAGSDLGAVMLKATWSEQKGTWLLNGVKRFITNGDGDVSLVLARTEEGTTDARGLSMLVYDKRDGGVKVRRIENKLGIKGSPTCELVFTNAPAQLVGDRKMGLIKYVMSLMNAARLGIGAQSVGLCEAAYREALKYANERAQFGKNIIRFAAISEMLSNMKAKTQGVRALLYETTRFVEIYKQYTHISHERPLEAEERQEMKYYNKLADGFTPLLKLFSSEYANQMAYDAIQIHGGTGFMKDFNVERFYRDARITNIYEGTTQLQVVAAIGGVIQRDNDQRIHELAGLEFTGKLARLRDMVMELYEDQLKAVKYVAEKKDPAYHDLMARSLVEMETYVFVGLLLLRDAAKCEDRAAIAERYVLDSVPEFRKRFMRVTSGDVTLIDNNRDIIDY